MRSGSKGKRKMIIEHEDNNQSQTGKTIVNISDKGKEKITKEDKINHANVTSLAGLDSNKGRIYRTIIDELDCSDPSPAYFASDEQSYCREWNVSMENFTGYKREDVIGKLLPGEIFGNMCVIKSYTMQMHFAIFLFQALAGQCKECFNFKFLNRHKQFVEMYVTFYPRYGVNGDVMGCFCVLEGQKTVKFSTENTLLDKGCKELQYLRHEILRQAGGLRVIHQLLAHKWIAADKPLTHVQKQYWLAAEACENQIKSILTEIDLESLGEGRSKLSMEEVRFKDLVHIVVSQVMIDLNKKGLDLTYEIPDKIKNLKIYVDKVKMQLVLTNLLVAIVEHSPQDSWIEFGVSVVKESSKDGKDYSQLRFRMTHPYPGLPSSLIEDMDLQDYTETTDEGLSLFLAQKLLRLMDGNGKVEYVRDDYTCCFVGDIELQTLKSHRSH